ncbi:unnamed protein product [Pseudo-nitzschia multistriata]|uniref:Uncharacterized protein n=1 Tax=Pseudo-nitzschia multistriata TaxID=183589 RepID=A0A448YUT8_9STRA|nr:unnamed protein product [Pseudo-nitzschia multistriata]
MNEILNDVYAHVEMRDDCPSTEESDISTFLEYARDVIAENNRSYDSASFLEFENLLQECAANHFLDSNGDGINDSMTSESTYSGYMNDGSESGSRYKKTPLLKDDIMSDNAYNRMKGIIARKRTASNRATRIEEIDAVTITSNHDVSSFSSRNQSESDVTDSEDVITELMVSKMNRLSSYRQRCDSDSSDSIADNTAVRQIRQRRARRRSNKKKLRGESLSGNDPKFLDDERFSAILESPTRKDQALSFLSRRAPDLYDSVVAHLDRACDDGTTFRENDFANHPSEEQSLQRNLDMISIESSTRAKLEIDTTNTILPSLVKKGIVYYDLPKIERALDRIVQKIDVTKTKQKMLNQLVERFEMERGERNLGQKGMASLHKLRARKKATLQAKFLRYAREQKYQHQHSFELQSSSTGTDYSSEPTTLGASDSEAIVRLVQHNPLTQPPVSAAPVLTSSGETKRLKKLLEKRKRSISHSRKFREKKSPLESQFMEQCLNSYRLEETASISKSSPFYKISFNRPKGDANYEVLSPDSSLTNDISLTSDYFSSSVDDIRPRYNGEIQVQSSDDSAWSEMSFQSESNRFTVSSTAPLLEKGNRGHAGQKFQVRRPLSVQTKHSKTINDSFEDIVLRNTPKPGSKGCWILFGGGDSPTGVEDIFSLQEGKGIGDALAFVDDDEGDHVFADKDDSFLIKSFEEMEILPEYHPVFFSPNRFEI